MKPALYRDGQRARLELSDPETGEVVDVVFELNQAEQFARDLQRRVAAGRPAQVVQPSSDTDPGIGFELSPADAAGLAAALIALVGEIRVGVN